MYKLNGIFHLSFPQRCLGRVRDTVIAQRCPFRVTRARLQFDGGKERGGGKYDGTGCASLDCRSRNTVTGSMDL